MKPGKMDAEEAKYRAEEDARTLMRAREVMRNKTRLEAAKKHVRDQMGAMDDAMKAMGHKGDHKAMMGDDE